MVDEVAGDYFGRWANAEREVFELKNKLAKQQDIIAKADHDATSAEITLLKNESAMKKKQIEDLESSSLRAKDTSRALEVEKLVAEINGLKLELAGERAKQQEVTEVPGSEVDSEDGCAAVLTSASSILGQTVDDRERIKQGVTTQHSKEAAVADPSTGHLKHREQSVEKMSVFSLSDAEVQMSRVLEDYATAIEGVADLLDNPKCDLSVESVIPELIRIDDKYLALLHALPDPPARDLKMDGTLENQIDEAIERLKPSTRVFKANQRTTRSDAREDGLKHYMARIEHAMSSHYDLENKPGMKPAVARFLEKYEVALRA
ncbi:hypothetical protein LTR97_003894 [Elasticomyces elasticus]|uniref:Uncharacterized protein n=1 Tax=Elasticomyces elasticus TaxID=574655 RepID=A0AAN8A420_9PEZI|nr:hypothetical protein LTR97_003894 [Elasticomyces elasticus]